MNIKPNTIMKTFEERYPEHDNPDWQILTWRQEEELEKAKAEHRNYVEVNASYEKLQMGHEVFKII